MLINQFVPVSIWAMNFAMMFALALGIDYALFLVVRYRAARPSRGATNRTAVAETMDTAGKAVLLSGLTVLISLSAVMIVPSPAFRSMAGGIMLAVVFVLAATLTLLPLVLAKLDHRINKLALPWSKAGEHRSPPSSGWGERLWRRPVRLRRGLADRAAGARRPDLRAEDGDALDQGAAGGRQRPHRLRPGPGRLRRGCPRRPAGRRRRPRTPTRPPPPWPPTPASRPPCRRMPATDDSGLVLVQAVPTVDPSDPELGETVDRLRADLPDSAQVGGAAVENLDLKAQLDESAPLVIGIVLVLGFLLLLVALQAPLISLLGTLASLLSTAAAFGVARLVFQEGFGAGLLGFESQGFLDAWAPVFFFAMIFAIAMDYTVFLLASAKEHWERSGDPREAMVGSVAHSGRVIFAAGAVMVAVFFTFALSGPLPPKEMGIILGVAVLLDAFLVRLVLLPVMLRLTGRAAWWSPALAAQGAAGHPVLARLSAGSFTARARAGVRRAPARAW